jgi:hypothetical protein
VLKYGVNNQILNLKSIFKMGMGHYFPLAIRLAPLFFLLACIKDFNLFFQLPYSNWLNCLQYVLMAFVLCFGFPIVGLTMSSDRFSYRRALAGKLKPAIKITMLLIFCVAFCIALAHAYFFAAHYLTSNRKEVINTFVSLVLFLSVPIAFVGTRYFFLPPILLLGERPILSAFFYSQQLVRGNFFRVLRLFSVVALFCLFCMQGARHEQLLAQSQLNIPFDFLLFLFVLPVLYSMTLILLEELKLRDKLGSKQIK